MNIFTKDADYAVRALVYLVQRAKKFYSTREIAKAQQIPISFLRRILGELTRAGLIKAREGIHGGVALNKKPQQISVGEIIELFQGNITVSSCMLAKKVCANQKQCLLRAKMQKIAQMVSKEFHAISIQDLAQEKI